MFEYVINYQNMKYLIPIFCLLTLVFSGCTLSKNHGTSDKEPLLLLAEERFIFCQDGKIFREMPSYPERNIFYFITQLSQSQISQAKDIMGNKEINFSGSEYEIPANIMPAKYPDSCLVEYNGCCDGTEKIKYNECEKMHKKMNEFIKAAGFNVENNYRTLVKLSIDKGMRIPVIDNDYALQINKLCGLPLASGKPVYDNKTWMVGQETNGHTFRFYSDVAATAGREEGTQTEDE